MAKKELTEEEKQKKWKMRQVIIKKLQNAGINVVDPLLETNEMGYDTKITKFKNALEDAMDNGGIGTVFMGYEAKSYFHKDYRDSPEYKLLFDEDYNPFDEEEIKLTTSIIKSVDREYDELITKPEEEAKKRREEKSKDFNKRLERGLQNGTLLEDIETLDDKLWEKYSIEAGEKHPDEFHQLSPNEEIIRTDLYKEYGNNYFELSTYSMNVDDVNSNKEYTFAGVLKELPSFSMGTTWEKGPASTISDAVKGFMCSSLMEMVTTIGGHDRSWMNLDEGTDRVYASTNKPSFSLVFKIYTTENLGSKKLTNYKIWLKALSFFAPPSIDTKTNIYNMGINAVDGVLGTIPVIQNTFDSAKKAFSNGTGFGALGDAIKAFADEAEAQIIKRDGPRRVSSTANADNFYGAKLWYLNIFPAFFKKPLIVYISNWGVTYSKELNRETLEPIWIEFKITCEMDQIASAPVWKRYLR